MSPADSTAPTDPDAPLPVASVSSAPLQQLLVDAEVAYDRGDYAGTRRCAVELLAAAPPDDLAGPARELLARLRPDRAAVVLTGLCAALFALVVGRYVF